MNLLPATAKTRGFTSRSQCLAFCGKIGASAKTGPFSSMTVFFSSRTAEACFRLGDGLLGRTLHFLMSPCAETDIKCPSTLRWSYWFAGPPSLLLIPAWAPVSIWVSEPCSCQTVFLLDSTLVLCSCCFSVWKVTSFWARLSNTQPHLQGQVQGPLRDGVFHGYYSPNSSTSTWTAEHSVWFHTFCFMPSPSLMVIFLRSGSMFFSYFISTTVKTFMLIPSAQL